VDFVIAAVGSKASNVFFELGLAAAIHKPVLLLVERETSIPTFVPHTTFVISDLKDSKILRLAVKRFLTEVDERSPRNRPRVHVELDPEVNRESIERIVKELRKGRDSLSGSAIERLTADLLWTATSTTVEEQRPGTDRGVDFALWNDALQASLGSPLLVEVKAGNISPQRFRETYNQLAQQVLRLGAAAEILLYLDRDARRFGKPEKWVPSFLAFDLEEFALELLKKPFEKVLVERRQ
jgi:hypothetical protein